MPLYPPASSNPSFFNAGVKIPNAKVHIVTTTTAAGNPKTLNIASLGLTAIYDINVTAWKNTSTIAVIPIPANIVSATTSLITYTVVESNSGALITEGLEINNATDVNLTFQIVGI